MTRWDQEKSFAKALRFLAVDAITQAGSGHPGLPLGMADVATLLWTRYLSISPWDPLWPNRDRFILSAGHGAMLLYGAAYMSGYQAMTLEAIKHFRRLGYPTHGHPEAVPSMGIEATTGPLGQGLAMAVGMAIAQKKSQARFGTEACDHKIYVLVGDGCLMEGISDEALSLAGHLKLDNLVILFDDNGISIDGPTHLTRSENILARMHSYGLESCVCDGHDFQAIDGVLKKAQTGVGPRFIAFKTTIGHGSPCYAGTEKIHGAPLSPDDVQKMRLSLDWPHKAFHVPETLLTSWRQKIKDRCSPKYEKWQKNQENRSHKNTYEAFVNTSLDGVSTKTESLKNLRETLALKHAATRVHTKEFLEVYADMDTRLMGGSADLSGSNGTYAASMKALTPGDFSGNYVHYGVREHAMAAIMNGIALHGGWRPYGGTFLVFSDYLRPALRLSALMKLPVIYVFTHDSLAVGEDGPTHQPIEHLASLRAMPNLAVIRPADGRETYEAWMYALNRQDGPTALILTRQKTALLPQPRDKDLPRVALGGYSVRDTHEGSELSMVLVATGSEVGLALSLQEKLAQENIPTRVVSMPCLGAFFSQGQAYQDRVLPPHVPRVVLELGVSMGWEGLIGPEGLFIGLDSFGASAPQEDVLKAVGFEVETLFHRLKSFETSCKKQPRF